VVDGGAGEGFSMVTELREGEGDAINPSKRDFQEFIERQTTS
jgi:hypothetical protein